MCMRRDGGGTGTGASCKRDGEEMNIAICRWHRCFRKQTHTQANIHTCTHARKPYISADGKRLGRQQQQQQQTNKQTNKQTNRKEGKQTEIKITRSGFQGTAAGPEERNCATSHYSAGGLVGHPQLITSLSRHRRPWFPPLRRP